MRRLFGTIGLTYLTVLAVAFYFYAVWLLIAVSAAGAVTVGAGIFLKHRQYKYAWTVIVAGGSALLAIAAIFLYKNYFYQPTVDYYSEKEISFEGYVCDEIQFGNKFLSVPIKTETVDGEPRQLKFDITIYSDTEAAEFDNVRGTLTLHRESRKNEISHGRWFYAAQDKTLSLESTGSKHFTPYQYAVAVRKEIKKTLDGLLPRRSAALCKAVLLGDKYALTKETRHDITRTGTSFLIVVSGMHLSVICGFFVFFFKKLRLRTVPMCLAVAVLIIGFTALTGFSRSVMRAGVMMLITYGSMLIRRKSDSLNSLGAAGLVLTVTNPFAAGDLGLIMSFTVTLGIILWAKKIDACLIFFFHIRSIKWRWLRRIPLFFTNLIAVSLAASLWMIPVTTLFFQRVSPLVMLISVFVEPIVFVLLIATLLTVILSFIPFAAVLTKLLGWGVNLLCALFLNIISAFAALPFSSVNVHHLFFYLWLGFTVLLVIAGYALRSKVRCTGKLILCSAAALILGWSVHALLGAQTSELMIRQSYRGVTIALCRNNRLNLLACGGNGTYNSDLLDALYSYGDRVNNLVLPNRINYSAYYSMIDAHFSIDTLYVNEKYRDEIGVSDGTDIANNSAFTLELDGSSRLTVLNIDDIVYQYLTVGDYSVLFVPHYGDIEKLPEKYRTADFVIMDFVSTHAELLSCTDLIYTGQQNSRWEKNYNSLLGICNNLTALKNETYILKLK